MSASAQTFPEQVSVAHRKPEAQSASELHELPLLPLVQKVLPLIDLTQKQEPLLSQLSPLAPVLQLNWAREV